MTKKLRDTGVDPFFKACAQVGMIFLCFDLSATAVAFFIKWIVK